MSRIPRAGALTMPKINHSRGETRESVRRKDPGTWGRKRHRQWGGKRHRTRRGRGGLTKDYRELFRDVAIRNWCPCCLSPIWSRLTRDSRKRAENKRIVHRALRRFGKQLCRDRATDE